MTSDHRITPGLIHDIVDALERHGYNRSDDLHADRAIGLIGDLACIYEGTQDHPATAYPIAVPPPPAYPRASSHDAITLTRADASTVSQQLRDAIADLYDAWWDKRAPGRTRFERAAATAARKRAMTGDWCAAAALDDDRLDTPGYQPEYGWKPATGTGVAPDIRPTAVRRRKSRA